jgi:hypothetical protein
LRDTAGTPTDWSGGIVSQAAVGELGEKELRPEIGGKLTVECGLRFAFVKRKDS